MESPDQLDTTVNTVDSPEEGSVESPVLTKHKRMRKRKHKKKKQNPDDSVQIIDEIPNSRGVTTPDGGQNDVSIEIISEKISGSETSSKQETKPATDSNQSTKVTHSSGIFDNVNKASNDTATKQTTDKADFISLSSDSESTAQLAESSKSAGNSQPEEGSSKTSRQHIRFDSEEGEDPLDSIFQIDTKPADSHNDVVPKYISKFSESALAEEKEPVKKSWRPVAQCFNCNGEHSMRDCTKPRNQRNINQNRNAFMEKKLMHTSASRYHLDHHQRFAHLSPGKISRRLRKALNLSHDQLPLHTYRMRLLGYPPAWLEEAKVKHSGITVFDSSGTALADPDDEDGEVEVDRCKYDMKKIIDFPGFNVRPPKGTLNESDYLGFPDMIPDQAKDKMISYLSPRAAVPYKKRKLDERDLPGGQAEDSEQNRTVRNSTDMEVDDVPETRFEPAGECAFIPALPSDPAPPPPPPPPPEEGEEEEEGEIHDDSDESERDGGVKRKREDTETESGKRKKSDTASPSTSSLPSTSTPPVPSAPPTSSLAKTSSTPNLGSIKTVDLGTPIIQHAVSTDRLPSHEAFAKDICDVINFDNLPDSTGKYKILSKVVKKVRSFMSKMTSGGKS